MRMMCKILSVFVMIAFCMISTGCVFAAESHVSKVVKVVNEFAFKTANLLMKDSDASSGSDLFFSPFSIISAFGMVYAGANAQTAQEMRNSLGFSDSLHENLGELVKEISCEALRNANRVWLDHDVKLLQDYELLLKKYYDSDTGLVKFTQNPNEAREIINSWVSRSTHNRIKDLIRKIEPDTRMILTNAVYFNAKWADAFDKNLTKKRPFKNAATEPIEVDMMSKTDNFSYGEVDGAKVIRIPYDVDGHNFAMLAVLPPENVEMNAFLSGVNQDLFSRWISSLSRRKVDLWLPKFRTEKRYELSDIFKKLGVQAAFTDHADFSGITSAEDLKIDSIIHQSFIELDEEKTEAAAATAVQMMRVTSARPMKVEIKQFHADRPFVYFIIDDNSGVIVFMGKQSFRE